ncbi:MAG: 4-hydroxy-tetrahydrodipicolinate synthase [Clostridiaceae bacterium]|nr:4-hydroxy-tetrahydrodipicolinate synthase [Clostridiaceae bacterium]
MKEKIFQGSGVAIVTPFTDDGINYDKLGELIEFQISEGTDAIIICGTTGEASTMPDEEHLDVIRYAVEKVAKRVPVIAGTGSNDTKHAVKLSTEAEKLGADALLSVTPYYNKTTQAGLYEHFKAIAESVSVPIILYNVPSRTNLNIDPATYEKLCKIPNINAVKECNLMQVPETVKRCGDELNLYSGEDGNVYFLLAAGGLGVISVMANIIPKFTHELVASYLRGETEKSWKMQLQCLDLVKALFCEVNPIPVKEALNYMGFNVGPCRMPLVGMSEKNKEFLIRELNNFGIKAYIH